MRLSLAALLLATCCVACGQPAHHRFELTVATLDDRGQPLSGVAVSSGRQKLGVSAAGSKLVAFIEGRDGAALPLDVSCPEGYRAAPVRRVVKLQRTTSDNRMTAALVCRPEKRNVALVIDTNMAHVPVMLGDKRVAVTDAYGSAHALITSKPGGTFHVTLDTSSRPRVIPASPVHTVKVRDAEAYHLIREGFKVKPKPRRRRRRVKKPEAHRPTILRDSRTFGSVEAKEARR